MSGGRDLKTREVPQLIILICFITEESDVSIFFPRIPLSPVVTPQNGLPTLSVGILFNQDRVAQEGNETFTLTFSITENALGDNPILRDTLNGTILDEDGNCYIIKLARA